MLLKRKICVSLHEFKLGHSSAETILNVINTWGDDTVSERTTRRWFEEFRAGDQSRKSEERGRLSEVDNDELVEGDGRCQPKGIPQEKLLRS